MVIRTVPESATIPMKNGRQSFKEKVGILASTNEVINLTLENGKHHTNFELEAFILAANICGQGRYRHIRYACDQAIASSITTVIDRLRRFQLA